MLRQFPRHLCTKMRYIAQIISYGSKGFKVLVQAHQIHYNSADTSLVRKDVLRTEVCGKKK